MYSTVSHLQTAIRQALQKGPLCRIYPESLVACWPNISADDRSTRIEQFAAQNHWDVAFRNLGNLGDVAQFTKQHDAQRAA